MKIEHLIAAEAAKKLVDIYKREGIQTVDSHRIERDMMKRFETAFARDFLKYIGEPDPLQAFSQDFGAWIKRDWTALVVPTSKRPVTATLRGTDSANQEWRVL